MYVDCPGGNICIKFSLGGPSFCISASTLLLDVFWSFGPSATSSHLCLLCYLEPLLFLKAASGFAL